jgi:uncharacterized protein (TIGR02453 family)
MIQKSTLQFLRALKKNNNKEWFDANRPAYELAKTDFLSLIERVIARSASFDGEIADVKAKDTLFRINRDVRFSKDKSPYKTHFGAYICFKGRKSTYPGYYVHLEPGAMMAGGGAYVLMPDELHKIRQEIDYNAKEFLKIINHKTFKSAYGKLEGETLVNPPKGFDASSEAIQYIKHKQWYVMTKFSDADALGKDFDKKVAGIFKILHPLNVFFQRAISD